MARFSPQRIAFGKPPPKGFDEAADPLPIPILRKQTERRLAGIKEAGEALSVLPGPGESLHCVCTARMDLTDVINGLVVHLGSVERLVIATLGYNKANLACLLGWLDRGAVRSLTLLASIFFRSHNGALWEQTLAELRTRRQRAACCHCHAKVITLAFASGVRMVIEGSANLCGNGSGREQFALFNDPVLHDWHATWITEVIDRHAPQT